MTIAFADTVDRQENKDLARWGVSLLLVLVFHVAVAWLVLPREAPVEPNKPPPPAALLDLPPLSAGPAPVSPAPPKPAVAPAAPPKPPAQEVKPPEPPAKEIKPPVPPTPPMLKFAVPLPPPVPPKPLPPRPQPPKAAPDTVSPPSGSAAPVYLDPMRVWQIAAMERLEKFKKQSVTANWRGEQGIVSLNITIDRQGNILSASIAGSSGYSSLDNQALSMCRLARRLPPLPPEFKLERYSFGVTIEFSIY